MNALDLAVVLWPELADLRHLDGWTWRRGEGPGDLGEVGLCGYRQLTVLWMDVLWIFGPDASAPPAATSTTPASSATSE